MTPSERARQWQTSQYHAGICPKCRQSHESINPQTGLRFWRCEPCRLNQRIESRERYNQFGRKPSSEKILRDLGVSHAETRSILQKRAAVAGCAG